MKVTIGRVLLAAVLLAGGCDSAGGNGTAGADPRATAGSDQDTYNGLLAYAKCMRSHGVSNFPDPVLGKGLQVNGDEVGSGTATYKAADDACLALKPPGSAGSDDATGDRAAALKYSQCMRDNGVTKFPDPKQDGSMDLDLGKLGMAPDNPVFVAAQKTCEKYDRGQK